jgi:hypothetical protein
MQAYFLILSFWLLFIILCSLLWMSLLCFPSFCFQYNGASSQSYHNFRGRGRGRGSAVSHIHSGISCFVLAFSTSNIILILNVAICITVVLAVSLCYTFLVSLELLYYLTGNIRYPNCLPHRFLPMQKWLLVYSYYQHFDT